MIIKTYGSCGIGTKNELLGVSTKEEEKEKEKRKKKRKEKRFQNSKIRKIKEITSLWLSREGWSKLVMKVVVRRKKRKRRRRKKEKEKEKKKKEERKKWKEGAEGEKRKKKERNLIEDKKAFRNALQPSCWLLIVWWLFGCCSFCGDIGFLVVFFFSLPFHTRCTMPAVQAACSWSKIPFPLSLNESGNIERRKEKKKEEKRKKKKKKKKKRNPSIPPDHHRQKSCRTLAKLINTSMSDWCFSFYHITALHSWWR